MKLLHERLIIETTNLEVQKELLSSEKGQYDSESQLDLEELRKLQETYKQLLAGKNKAQKTIRVRK